MILQKSPLFQLDLLHRSIEDFVDETTLLDAKPCSAMISLSFRSSGIIAAWQKEGWPSG
jgi:hypothetical protein